MKDIDFDELDKAVSSVLTGPSTDTAEATDSNEPSAPATNPERPASVTPPAARTASPSLPSKRRGQFMDVVHPSSDMTSGNLMATRSQPVIQPLATQPAFEPSPVEDTETPPAMASNPEGESEAPTSTSPDTLPATTSHDWPDPLDVMSERENTHTDPAPTEPMSASEDTAAVENTHETVAPTEDEPLLLATNPTDDTPAAQTPFLDGTNVEKRPLGAFASDEVDEAAETDELADKLGTTPQAAASLPPELDSEVVAIEEQHDTPDIPDEETEVTPSEKSPVTPQPLVAQSIPQQYTPETNHAAETATQPHPVFDTKDYHQPLVAADAKPKKGKTGLIILVLVIMLVLGAGLGFLAWQYGLV